MSTIAGDWDAMCTLFLKNAARFNLALPEPQSSELEIFCDVFENGYVQTLVGQWVTALTCDSPPEISAVDDLSAEDDDAGKSEAQQADLTNLTTELSATAAGRYVVVAAGQQIAANQAIISERAFALVPVNATTTTAAETAGSSPTTPPLLRCSVCADWRSHESMRCPGCARVSYCSRECRDTLGAARVHRFECKGHRLGVFGGALGVSHLAVRTLLVGGPQLERLLAGREARSMPDELPALWSDLLVAAEERAADVDYARVLRLMTNYAKSQPEDLMRYALTAVMLTMYLQQHTDYFNQSERAALVASSPILTGALIFKHIGQIVNNAHTICGLLVTTTAGDRIPCGHLHDHIQLDVVATALYPRIALLNHSCAPNIRNRFDGTRLTVSARTALAAGAEVLNCYCSVDALLAGDERRQLLSAQYGFECACTRCSNETTTTTGAVGTADTYLCACGGRVLTQPAQRLWWRTGDRPAEALRCAKCERDVDFEWYDRFMMMFERETNGGAQRKWLAADTCRLYADEMVPRLEVGHTLRFDMASMVVKLFPLHELALSADDAELMALLMPVAADYALGTKLQFTGASLEHIEAAGIWLDLLALRRHLWPTSLPLSTTEQHFVKEIRDAIDAVASANVQPFYAKYFADYLQ